MFRYLMSLVVISVCCDAYEATSSCKRKIADSYLDIAVDMIGKAKIAASGDCESKHIYNYTKEALDCSEIFQRGYNRSGVYRIWPANRITAEKSIEVYCDMHTDGGGWTVIQRRGQFQNAEDYFFKNWASYKEGFGDIEKEFWLGNDNIFALSNQNLYSVRFDLRDVKNDSRYALYDTFWIDDQDRQYTLHITGYTGDAGDSMARHNNQKFSTVDKEHSETCAKSYRGGWWYNNCYEANLNGLNLRGKHDKEIRGISWQKWKGYEESLISTEIKIRPKNFKLHHSSLNTPL